ncbi:glycosyltransferase [Gordonia sp. ABSL49_1]|uniref:glycosyltransferase n=1 Tax=Gordonia sp. ABSL49_1 TaxID=2920941 RepID=UPI001F0F43A3|nr:glycosyltransferase [Gordonia sp. ABSL49_1]MCH5645480.1 glycosyltransferase [Gordonia sp. ABSL49_1]
MTSATLPATFSILVPSFNPGPYLRLALESALEQMGPDDELIVQDAMSSDGSSEVYTEVAERDPRVKVIAEKDSGQSDALNRCLGRAKSPWSIWLNADDVLRPGALEAVRTAINEADNADVVIGAHQIVRADGSVVDNYAGRPLNIDRIISRGCVAFSGSIVARTEFLRAVGGFDDSLNTVMDLELQLRMADAHPDQVVIPDVVGALRFHELSKTANLWRQFIAESHTARLSYANTWRRKRSGYTATFLHFVSVAVFRMRLTPQYRRVRRLVTRQAATPTPR